jgi:alpha-amylase/alpha-mannosidase (GH57 family)
VPRETIVGYNSGSTLIGQAIAKSQITSMVHSTTEQAVHEHSPLMESRRENDSDGGFVGGQVEGKDLDDSSKSGWYLFLLTISIGG